jgi:hypothetical protein
MKTIHFTRVKLNDLRGSYQKALHSGHDEFEFEGQRVLTAYAKYLIEYLDTQFKPDTAIIEHPFGTD